MNNKYIQFLVNFIKGQVDKFNLDKDSIDKLLNNKEDTIREMASNFNYPEIDDITLTEYFKKAIVIYNSNNVIDISDKESITRKGFETWLKGDRLNITWNYSNRYFNYLNEIGRSESVIEEARNASLDIMGKLADPLSYKKSYVKGLVVGEVQSGKTGNFNAVINRAIDTGYKMIIVLSGTMEDLRRQTQDRIENDVVGEGRDSDTQTLGVKGVGLMELFGPRGNNEVVPITSITSVKSDFSKAIKEADFSVNRTNILVCKKNVSLLRNLIGWIDDSKGNSPQLNLPLLILDDEADNASLNNYGSKGKEYASKINGQIRALLDLFSVKTYLGYTATPFANVLQDRNDKPEGYWIEKYKVNNEYEERNFGQVDNIFPDDFIELLKSPSNYVGAKQIFETVEPIENEWEDNRKIPLIEIIKDSVENFPSRVLKNDPKKGLERINNKDEWELKIRMDGSYEDFYSFIEYKKGTRAANKYDGFPVNIPRSLKEAVNCFVLSMAIRESRKKQMIGTPFFNPHHTMLVHISRFTTWQNKTKELLQDYVNELTSRIDNDNPESVNSIYFELETDWYNNYAEIIENIRKYLPSNYSDDFMKPVVFDSLKPNLAKTISGLEVKAINSVTKEKLEYPKSSPKKVIAVGGNRLSRGFTLEGLTINYFVRTTDYSDSLLQMGRWFGYRPGYLDCCKIYSTEDSIEKFDSTTKCIESLELLFRKMSKLNREPRNFAIRVQKHPGVLKITRNSILKNAIEEKWSFEDQLEMTTTFDISKLKMNNCLNSFNNNIAPKLKEEIRDNKGKLIYLTYKTDGPGIINILKKENNFDEKEDVPGMIKFIELCNEKNLLNDWTIALKTTGTARELNKDLVKLPKDYKSINMAIRRGPEASDPASEKFLNKNEFRATGKNANIVSSGLDFSILLSDSQILSAEEKFVQEKLEYYKKKGFPTEVALKKAKKVTKPERIYREKMSDQQGLLLIYLFDSKYVFNMEGGNKRPVEDYEQFYNYVRDKDINIDIPLVGYAIGFPPMETDVGGVFMKGNYELDEVLDEDVESLENELNEDLIFED